MTVITFRNCPFHCQNAFSLAFPNASLFFFLLFALIAFFLLSQIRILLLSHVFFTSTSSCSTSPPLMSNVSSKLQEDVTFLPLPPHQLTGANLTDEERKFWEQPDGLGYRPCIEFGLAYRKASASIFKEKRKFLVVAVSGGLNQQRNQIIDAVVIARILEAALVVPILKLKDEGVLFLKGGLDSKLSKDLPLDLQRLRCKVAFHALRFAAPIREVGEQMARRMWDGGPYIALHMRLEKDVWARNACPSGLGPEYDETIVREIDGRPAAANPCPLNAFQVARLLKGLGAPRSARVYLAGGEAFGGEKAVRPLKAEFPNLRSKDDLALDGELERFANRSSALAAIDFMVSLSSDVFMPSHGGNMGRLMKVQSFFIDGFLSAQITYLMFFPRTALLAAYWNVMRQGHRAYAGHRKYITPNKKIILPMFAEKTLSDEEFSNAVKQIHVGLMGQPIVRTKKSHVISHPVPECMCKRKRKPAPSDSSLFELRG
ncbi:hypothetical protein ACLOJK_012006 [Asimina triloba]